MIYYIHKLKQKQKTTETKEIKETRKEKDTQEMVKVILELDYDSFNEANNNDPYLSSLISSSKCVSFERKEEVAGIKEFMYKRDNKVKELYANMEIDPKEVDKAMKQKIERMAFEWANENYYYRPMIFSASTKKY